MNPVTSLVLVGTNGTKGVLDLLKENIRPGGYDVSISLVGASSFDDDTNPNGKAVRLSEKAALNAGCESFVPTLVVSVAFCAKDADGKEIRGFSSTDELFDFLYEYSESDYLLCIGLSFHHTHNRSLISVAFDVKLCVRRITSDDLEQTNTVGDELLPDYGPERLYGHIRAFLEGPELDEEMIVSKIRTEMSDIGFDYVLVRPAQEITSGEY